MSSSMFSRSRSYSSQSSTGADGTKFRGTSLAPMPTQRLRSGSTRSIKANAEDMRRSVSAAAGTSRVVGWASNEASPAPSLAGHSRSTAAAPDAADAEAAALPSATTSTPTAPPSAWTAFADRRPSATSVDESRMRSTASTPDVLNQNVYTAPNSPDVAPSELSEMDLHTTTAPTSPAYNTIDMPTDFFTVTSVDRASAPSPPVDEQGQLRPGGARITLTPNSSRPVSRADPPPPPPSSPPPPVPPKSPRHQTFGAASLAASQPDEPVPSSSTFGNLTQTASGAVGAASTDAAAAATPVAARMTPSVSQQSTQMASSTSGLSTVHMTPSTSGWSVETDPAAAPASAVAPSGIVSQAPAATAVADDATPTAEAGAAAAAAKSSSKPPIPPPSSRTRALHAIRARSGNFPSRGGASSGGSVRGISRPVSNAAVRRRYSADHLGGPSYRRGTFVPLSERGGAVPRLGVLRAATTASAAGSAPGSPMPTSSTLAESAQEHDSPHAQESVKELESPAAQSATLSHKSSISGGAASGNPLQAALWVAGAPNGQAWPSSPSVVSLPGAATGSRTVSRAGSVVQGPPGKQTWMVDGQTFEDPPAGSPRAASAVGWKTTASPPMQSTALGLHEDAQPKEKEKERDEGRQAKPRAASADTVKGGGGYTSNRNRSDTLTSTGSTLSKFSSWSKSARKTASGGFKSSHSSGPSAGTHDSAVAYAGKGAPQPAEHEDAVEDSPATDENGNAPTGAYAIRPPSYEELQQAAALNVLDENGQAIPFGQLFAQRRTIFCFLRHWLCPFCQMFTESLRFIDPLPLERAGLDLVVVGQGHWHVTKAYKEVMGVPAWIQMYSDPSRKIYKALGMTLRTNDAGPACARPDYQTRGAFKGTMVAMKRGVWDMPLRPPGDLKLLGGEFILGPGLQVTFTHRMVTVRDHMDLRRVLVQAGCDMSLKTPINVLDERETSSKPPSTRSLGRKRSAATTLRRFGRKSAAPAPAMPNGSGAGGSQQDLRTARSSLSRPGTAKTAPRMPTSRSGLFRSGLVPVDAGEASIASNRPVSQGSVRAGYASSVKDAPTDYGDRDYRYEADNSLPPARRPSTAASTSRISVAGAPSPAFAMAAAASSGTMSPLLAVAAERTAAAASASRTIPQSFSTTSLVPSVSGSLAPRPMSSMSMSSERPLTTSMSRPGSALSKLRQGPALTTTPTTATAALPSSSSRPSTASGALGGDSNADNASSLSRNRASGLPLSLFDSRIIGSTATRTSVDGTPLVASPVIGSNTSFSNAGAAPASPLLASFTDKQATSPIVKSDKSLAVHTSSVAQRSALTPISDVEDIKGSPSPVLAGSSSKIASGALPALPPQDDDDENSLDCSDDSDSDSERSLRDVNRSTGALSSRSAGAVSSRSGVALKPQDTPTLGGGIERTDAGFGGSFLDDLDDVDGFGSRTPGSNAAPTPELSTLYEGDSSDDETTNWPQPVGPAPVETAAYSDDSDREGIEPNRWDGNSVHGSSRGARSTGSRSAASNRSTSTPGANAAWRDEDEDSEDDDLDGTRSPAPLSAPVSDSGRSPYQAAADGRAPHAPLHATGDANDDVDSLGSDSDGSFSGDEYEGATSRHVEEAEIRTASYRAPPHRLYKASSFSRLPSRRLSAFMEEDEEEEEMEHDEHGQQQEDIEEDYESEDDDEARSEIAHQTRDEPSSPTWTEPLRASAPDSAAHGQDDDEGDYEDEDDVEEAETVDVIGSAGGEKHVEEPSAAIDDDVRGVLDADGLGDVSDEASEATPLARPTPLPEVDLRA